MTKLKKSKGRCPANLIAKHLPLFISVWIKKENQSFHSGEELVKEIRKYLDVNKRKTTLNELSMLFQYNGNYLYRIFQKKMGRTIREYKYRKLFIYCRKPTCPSFRSLNRSVFQAVHNL